MLQTKQTPREINRIFRNKTQHPQAANTQLAQDSRREWGFHQQDGLRHKSLTTTTAFYVKPVQIALLSKA